MKVACSVNPYICRLNFCVHDHICTCSRIKISMWALRRTTSVAIVHTWQFRKYITASMTVCTFLADNNDEATNFTDKQATLESSLVSVAH